jgi:hypothetical protein
MQPGRSGSTLPSLEPAFDSAGKVRDPDFPRRTDTFIKELIWLARMLRHGREQIALE